MLPPAQSARVEAASLAAAEVVCTFRPSPCRACVRVCLDARLAAWKFASIPTIKTGQKLPLAQDEIRV